MELVDGYRLALKSCIRRYDCQRCKRELAKLDAHLAKAEATTGGQAIVVMRIEPAVHKGKVGHGKSGPILLDHYGTGRTYIKHKPGYNG